MSAPGFWHYETTGRLRPVIEAYLLGKRLSYDDVSTMRAYLRQWIMSPVWDENPWELAPHVPYPEACASLARLRERIDGLISQVAIDRWLEDAERLGLDPL
jgi:hypothetical protein